MNIPITALREDAPGTENARHLAEGFSRTESGDEIILSPGHYEVCNEQSAALFHALMDGRIAATDYAAWKQNKNVAMTLRDLKNVTIDGQGAVLSFSGLIQPFSFENCRYLHIRNLRIDWTRPPFSTGSVLSSDENGLLIKVDPEYPIQGGEPVVSYQDYDIDRQRPGGYCVFSDVENLSCPVSQIALVQGPETADIAAGKRIILRHIYSFAPVFHLLNCSYVSFENVTICAGAGMGIIAHGCSDLVFDQLRVIPSAGRLMSVNCDATHFIGCSGEIVFRDCEFEAMGDDAANVHGFYLRGTRTLSPGALEAELEVTTQDFLMEAPSPGDQVEFVHKETLLPYASRTVWQVDSLEGQKVLLQFDGPLPDGFRPGDLLTNRSRIASLLFERCRVRNIRGRAVLIQTRNAVVQDCVFEGCTGEGIHINTAEGWAESCACENIQILRNRFINCGYGHTKYCDAVGVVVGTECQSPAVGVHRRITIRDNYMQSTRPGIVLQCARDVTISGTVFQDCPVAVQAAYTDMLAVRDCPADLLQLGVETSHITLDGRPVTKETVHAGNEKRHSEPTQ